MIIISYITSLLSTIFKIYRYYMKKIYEYSKFLKTHPYKKIYELPVDAQLFFCNPHVLACAKNTIPIFEKYKKFIMVK